MNEQIIGGLVAFAAVGYCFLECFFALADEFERNSKKRKNNAE